MSLTFVRALEVAGMRPREVVADGKWRRCATDDHPHKRNGAYRLDYSGRRGWWKNWALDDGVNSWTDESATLARPIDQAKLQAMRDKERAQRIRAIHAARAFWQHARPLTRPHPYLERKGLSALGCAGLRQHDDLLVIPVMWRGRVISVQTIAPDGTKRFWPNAPVKAGHYCIDRPRAAVTAIAEGFATGLAIFQSVRHARVIVAFDAGNLLPVAEALRPCGSVVICADNDWRTQAKRGFNPGREKAANAADLIGCGVAWPDGIEGSDWCDWLQEVGANAARQMERLVLSSARYVMAKEVMA